MGTTEVSFPGLGWTINIRDVAFSIGKIDVYWYGIIIALGIFLCVVLAMKQAKSVNFSPDFVYDIIIVGLPSAIIGARLYYVIFKWEYYSKHLTKIFDTRSGGLAIYGGVIGAVLGVWIMCRIRKIPFSTVFDYAMVYFPLGQAIGRWGNFVNQEAFGTTTTLPWGMTSSKVQEYLIRNCPGLDSTMPVHPTFLYESLCNIVLFFILIQVRKRSKHAYETGCVYLAAYGTVRFLIEGLRTDSLYIGNTNMRASQILALVMVVASLIYIAIAHLKDIKRVDLPEKCFAKKAEVTVESAEETEVTETVETAETTETVETAETEEPTETK